MHPSTTADFEPPSLLVFELWGLGDLALAMPFLQAASSHAKVTVVAKPHADLLLRRFAPGVAHIQLTAPWTAFQAKYRVMRWPWRALKQAVSHLRAHDFDLGVTARQDPRDHILLRLSRAHRRLGFARLGSGVLLTETLRPPTRPHRAEYWLGLATALGWKLHPPKDQPSAGRRIVIHAGAGHPVRQWPLERFRDLSGRLEAVGWNVELIHPESNDLEKLIRTLAEADWFIGNDSGPGHIAALLGVPTFTIFGPQRPDLFAPQHPRSTWIEGAPCRYRPCFDRCHFTEPFCIRDIGMDTVWQKLTAWLPA